MFVDQLTYLLRAVFGWFGITGLSLGIMILLVAAVFVGCMILGGMADSIIGGNSFGIFINGLLLMTGAIATIVLWRYSGIGFRGQMLPVALFAAGVGGGALLMISIILRRYV